MCRLVPKAVAAGGWVAVNNGVAEAAGWWIGGGGRVRACVCVCVSV